MANPKPRVLVLYGGQSPEHAVSCVTAAGVLKAIDTSLFEVIPVGITPTGEWTVPSEDPKDYSFQEQGELPEVRSGGPTVLLNPGVNGAKGRQAELLTIHPDGTYTSLGLVDVVFPLLHGPFGEDGTLQGYLEMVGLTYVGAGVLASAMGMDKQYMKVAFESAGLKVGPYKTITAKEWATDSAACLDSLRELELPLFVKPARGGSSVGITRVDQWSQLEEAIVAAQQHDPKVIVEHGINGREIECGVLGSPGNAPARASLCGEIIVEEDTDTQQFYDFTAKYTDDSATDLACPADLPADVSKEIQHKAIIAFNALGAEGISRADFFYTTHGDVIINEVNTMPGFTPISMYPKMWETTGLPYPALISELITLAMKRPTRLR